MRILRLRAEGFRSFKELDWSPGHLNVLIGPNGSGKSNLLRLVQLASISARGGLGEHVQRQGGIEPLLWDHRVERLRFRVDTSPVDEHRDISRDALAYELTLRRIGQGSGYRIEHELLGNYHKVETGESTQPFKFLERTPHRAVVFDDSERSLSAPEDELPEEETLLSLAGGPFAANRILDDFKRQLSAWSVYHDFHTDLTAPIRLPSVARNERRVSPDGQNLISVLHTLYAESRDFRHEVNSAMGAAFGPDFEELVFPPAADQRIQLRVAWGSLKSQQSAADLSDGTLRFLLLLAVLANPDPPAVMAIDEPETGLHPSMFPIIAEHAVEASRRSQVILTTHSPELLSAFTEVTPTTSVLEWKNGQSHVRTLSGEDLEHWLKEYSLGELYRTRELENL